ncbi:methyl-accepting chemotaxis protein [Agarivorans aestuarii]|uniref:Methyl-accepting chemotaxis protein n=1 Tax=Agarivorans aestuarii TaxID=1563703 RepID=A0ABU7G2D2_9ALTE|nr:methyl-accepting chemotaxis protein [Agarivorans aestuarii]MEE1673361.1 methyl-accepting chemotaxis protein [Agarivorans aestuarii]
MFLQQPFKKQLTLVHHLALSMALQFAIASGIVMIALWGMNQLSHSFKQLDEQALPVAELAAQIDRAALQLDRQLRNTISSPNSEVFSQQRELFDAQLNTVTLALNVFTHFSQGLELLSDEEALITGSVGELNQEMQSLLASVEKRLELGREIAATQGLVLYAMGSARDEMSRLVPILFADIAESKMAYDAFVADAASLMNAELELVTTQEPRNAQTQLKQIQSYVSRLRFNYNILLNDNHELAEYPSVSMAIGILEKAVLDNGLFGLQAQQVILKDAISKDIAKLSEPLDILQIHLEQLLAEGAVIIDSAKQNTQSTTLRSQRLLLGLSAVGIVVFVGLCIAIVRLVRSRIKQIGQAIHKLSQGDFTHSCNVSSPREFRKLANWLNKASEHNRSNIVQLRERGIELKQAAEASAKITHSQQQQLAEQENRIALIASSVVQMDATMGDIANAGNDAAQDSQLSAELAEQGKQTLVNTSAHLQGLADKMQRNAQRMSELDQQVDQVGEVVQVINSIAERTNLLALNAAIEAARAGQHGRGFAVVADEVRKLAGQTREQTDSISEMINTLHSATNKARESMASCQNEMQSTQQLSERLSLAMNDIEQAVCTVRQQTISISRSTTEQNQASHHVNQAVDDLVKQSQLRQSQIDQLSVQSDQVAAIANEQGQSLAAFKV